MINILVVDSNTVYRRGLISILEDYSDFRVVGGAADSQEAVAKAAEIQPDIAIIDAFISGGEGVGVITFLQKKFPHMKVLIHTASDQRNDVLEAMKAGAGGYLLKGVEPEELIESIRFVASGAATVCPPSVFRQPDELKEANNTSKNKGSDLSAREKEVLQLVAQGASNKEIAIACYVSETTVKAHLRKILDKLCVRNRAHAAVIATEKCLLNQPQDRTDNRINSLHAALTE